MEDFLVFVRKAYLIKGNPVILRVKRTAVFAELGHLLGLQGPVDTGRRQSEHGDSHSKQLNLPKYQKGHHDAHQGGGDGHGPGRPADDGDKDHPNPRYLQDKLLKNGVGRPGLSCPLCRLG